MMMNALKKWSGGFVFAIIVLLPAPSFALEKPHVLIEKTVQTLLDEFTNQRELFQTDQRELFAMVDRVAAPLFDFERISKLVLAKHWKRASAQQRSQFSEEFKKLLIATYATALFKYTGNETMTFTGTEIRERKGRKFAGVTSEVRLDSGGEAILVKYSLILRKDERWTIYNLSIGGLNMITSYRETYGATIGKLGIDGMLESLKESNAKNF